MAGFEIPYGLRRLTSGPDSEWYGPYASISAANAAVPVAVRLDRTVKIGNTEYWWIDGTADINLTEKASTVTIGNGLYYDVDDNLAVGGALTEDLNFSKIGGAGNRVTTNYNQSESQIEIQSTYDFSGQIREAGFLIDNTFEFGPGFESTPALRAYYSVNGTRYILIDIHQNIANGDQYTAYSSLGRLRLKPNVSNSGARDIVSIEGGVLAFTADGSLDSEFFADEISLIRGKGYGQRLFFTLPDATTSDYITSVPPNPILNYYLAVADGVELGDSDRKRIRWWNGSEWKYLAEETPGQGLVDLIFADSTQFGASTFQFDIPFIFGNDLGNGFASFTFGYNNGLTDNGSELILGGALSQDTIIEGQGYNLSFGDFSGTALGRFDVVVDYSFDNQGISFSEASSGSVFSMDNVTFQMNQVNPLTGETLFANFSSSNGAIFERTIESGNTVESVLILQRASIDPEAIGIGLDLAFNVASIIDGSLRFVVESDTLGDEQSSISLRGTASGAVVDFMKIDSKFSRKAYFYGPVTPPQYTTAGSPAAVFHEGAIIYDTDLNALRVSDGLNWVSLGTSSSAAPNIFTVNDSGDAITFDGLECVYKGDTSAGSFASTLPSAVSNSGKKIHLKLVGNNTWTVNSTSSQTFDGDSGPLILSVIGTSITLIADNGNWLII